jgi:hypothetical protein
MGGALCDQPVVAAPSIPSATDAPAIYLIFMNVLSIVVSG